MPRQKIEGIGSKGIAKDLKPSSQPVQFWTDGKNIRFTNGKAIPFAGSTLFSSTSAVPPMWVGFAPSTTEHLWLYASEDTVRAIDGSNDTDITRTVGGAYAATAEENWQLEMAGGLPILNNTFDVPQVWNPPALATALVDLPNWPAGYTAKVIKAFKSHLFAMNLSQSGPAYYPHDVLFSDEFDAGSVPGSWDITDATKNAGRFSLDDTGKGVITAALSLGESLIIYKEKSAWAISFVGGQSIFDKHQVLTDVGIQYKRTLVGVPGATHRHFFQSIDNFYTYDGSELKPVFYNRVSNWIFNNIDSDNKYLVFSVVDEVNNEVWFCFPETDESYCTLAAVWNYLEDTVTFRSLGNVMHIASGFDTSPSIRWGESGLGVPGTPFSDGSYFDDDVGFLEIKVEKSDLLMLEAIYPDSYLAISNKGTDFYGTSLEAFLERTNIGLEGKTSNGNFIYNNTHRKLLARMWPHVVKGDIDVYWGVSEYETDAPTYSGPFNYTELMNYLDPNTPVSGRFIHFKFVKATGSYFELDGFDFSQSFLGMI